MAFLKILPLFIIGLLIDFMILCGLKFFFEPLLGNVWSVVLALLIYFGRETVNKLVNRAVVQYNISKLDKGTQELLSKIQKQMEDEDNK